MKPDWHDLAHELAAIDDGVLISLDDGRDHFVEVLERDDVWELSGFVADASTMIRANLAPDELWRRNRALTLVGYVVDDEGSAWVSAWLPRDGTTSTEFASAAHSVAVEADRLEYYLTGDDVF